MVDTEFAIRQKWKIQVEVIEIASGVKTRPKRDGLLKIDRQRTIDRFLVQGLDRFRGRLPDLIATHDVLN